MAGGSIYAGFTREPYNIKDPHTRVGVLITLVGAAAIIFFIPNPFMGLIISQVLLSIQLPWTIFTQIRLTSTPRVMGKFVNTRASNITLWTVAAVVSGLNVLLLWNYLKPLVK